MSEYIDNLFVQNQWKTSDFDYILPQKLIAQYPVSPRSASRLLYVDRKKKIFAHQQFNQFLDFLKPNDLLVFNNTKVIPARLYGYKKSGGRVECLVERVLSENRFLSHIRASKPPKIGSEIIIADDFRILIKGRNQDLFDCVTDSTTLILNLLYQYGEIPLPPYISRKPTLKDEAYYQTIFAEKPGAIAAPTAGLHFDESMREALHKKKISMAYVTLHVGAGTFQPVRVELLTEHHMHSEWIEVPEAVCDAITLCNERKGRVIAVGTTVMRCLETASRSGKCKPYSGETNLFIYPGFRFSCVNALLTNFHLPKSSLLMLVCAFGGYEFMMRTYQEAVKNEYRFFSYGDAMLIS